MATAAFSPAAIAAKQLQSRGKTLKMGQRVQFIHIRAAPGVRAWDLPLPLDPRQVFCVMGKARAWSLPPSLDDVGEVLDIEHKKDAEGKRLCGVITDNTRRMGQLIDDLRWLLADGGVAQLR